MAIFGLVGCKSDAPAPSKQSSVGPSMIPDTQDPAAAAGIAAATAKFKDKMDFNLDDVKKGKTCGSIRKNQLSFNYLPWPPAIQTFLAGEYAKFDFIKLVLPKLEGIYLVEFVPDLALGLTCHDGRTDKYVVFINKSVVALARDTSKVDVASYVFDGRSQGTPVVESRGDGALQTLLHESFHVIDLGYYYDDLLKMLSGEQPRDAVRAAARKKLYDAAWASPTVSLFQDQLAQADAGAGAGPADAQAPSQLPVASNQSGEAASAPARASLPASDSGSGLLLRDNGAKPASKSAPALLDHVEAALAAGHAEDVRAWRKPGGLSLADAGPDIGALERRLKVIADKTNFTNDDATSNFIEDFAVTFEAYYVGTRYDIWDREEFFAPLSPYVFTTKDLLKPSTPQGLKTCAAVRDILGETCHL